VLNVRGLVRPGLEPVTLSVAPGECVALVGPSGSGKSLLLRAIADLDPNRGEVSLGDTRREDLAAPQWRRRVAYVPAESGWWADGAAAHFPEGEKTTALLDRVGLPEEILESPVARLSTGERQRLALVRTLLMEPDVLLLDEPTSGLDQVAAGHVEAILRECLDREAAILIVTHDPDQVERLAQRRLTIKDGRIGDGDGTAVNAADEASR